MSDAYMLGVEAYERGDEMEMNPYLQGDGQYDEWRAGWFDCYAEDK